MASKIQTTRLAIFPEVRLPVFTGAAAVIIAFSTSAIADKDGDSRPKYFSTTRGRTA